jgi:zinc/manganese transport system substrate-binding protein
MKTLHSTLFLVLAAFVGFAHANPAADKLRVVATIPDLADVVREIGGDRVDVVSITKGRENLHLVSGLPSHMIAISKADLFVQVGLSLEVAFVPSLMETARNKRIQPGQPGFVNVSEGWEALDRPTNLSRQAGDVHPPGKLFAQRILEGLVRIDPDSKAAYEARFESYSKRLDEAAARWTEAEKSWVGKRVVVYHQEYNYLCRAGGIEIVGTIEVKPGIPPTPNHLAGLVATMKRSGCTTILTAAWSNDDEVAQVAKATGAKVVELPNQCGGGQGTETWIGMMDVIHGKVGAALGATNAAK